MEKRRLEASSIIISQIMLPQDANRAGRKNCIDINGLLVQNTTYSIFKKKTLR